MYEIKNCPICGTQSDCNIPSINKNIKYLQCINCFSFYQESLPIDITDDNYYKNKKFIKLIKCKGVKIRSGVFEQRNNEFYNSNLKKIITNNSDILDVGCGFGIISRLLISEKKCNVDGIEPHLYCFEISKRVLGDNVYNCSYEEYCTTKKYDYIISRDSIEHFISPKVYIEKSFNLLRDGGYIIFSTPIIPDVIELDPKKRANHKIYSFYPEHFYLYSKKAIHLLLSKFKYIQISNKCVIAKKGKN